MKNLIITSISALVLAMAFTGCGGSGSASNEANGGTSKPLVTQPEVVQSGVANNGNTNQTTITNEFGLNPTLGTPPPLPAR